MKIGNLYGFELFIRRQKEPYEDKGLFEYRYHNIFYAEGKESGIKYLWNQGYINTDNPKLAARFFLNAIDRVETLKEKYQKSLSELEQNIKMMEQIAVKPFEKDIELSQLKTDVAKLEREISIKIQTNQMKQHAEDMQPAPQKNDAVVVELNAGTNGNLITKNNHGERLLIKNEIAPKKVKGLRI